MKNLLFYDIEVFKNNNLVVFKDMDNNILGAWWDNFPSRSTLIAELIKGKTLVGYNNYYYDDKILTLMERGVDVDIIKHNNDLIIKGEDIGIKPAYDSLDCFQQIDVSVPSLKKIEGNMGKMIKESDISFDIDRPLTEEEKEQVLKYCAYDVESTIEVYKLREHSYFESKSKLVSMLENPRANKWNTTTISANILLDKPIPRWTKMRVPEDIFNLDTLPQDVREMWSEMNDYNAQEPSKKSMTMELFDNEVVFAWGGLHSAHRTIKRFKNVKLLDVASMYPSIAIKLGVLGDSTPKYAQMKEDRIKVKHTDKPLSNALKLVLNSVYGNLKNQYSILNNPKASMTVCVYGQIALFDLCTRLYKRGCTIVQGNTDGVAFVDNGCSYDDIVETWEEKYGLNLEEDRFKLWIQKDVNNYVSVGEDGHIKTKGGDVGKYQTDKFFSTNNARIIDIAITEYLINDTSPLDTLLSHVGEPLLYQYILQAGRTYKGVYDSTGHKYNNVNRIFACQPKYADLKLYKVRQDNGLVNFADVPDNMRVWNDDVNDITDFANWVDLNHYYQIIQKKLKAWK